MVNNRIHNLKGGQEGRKRRKRRKEYIRNQLKRFVLPFQYSLFPFIIYIDIAHSFFSSGILHNLSRIERAAIITAVYKDETFSIDANVTFDHIFIIIVNNNILLDRIKNMFYDVLSNIPLFPATTPYLAARGDICRDKFGQR